MFTFAFATGIENSVPTIKGGSDRVDELEKCGFYRHWKTDFALVQDMGIQFLRFGPPIHKTWLGDGKYDWSFADETFAELKRLNILPIIDLCHFGVPDWFMRNHLRHHCVMGNDYYQTNEHRVWADGTTSAAGEVFGYDEITRQYFDRYRLPVMHTETNISQGPNGDEAVYWLWKEWANLLRIRNAGIPIVGFTWYSLTDQVDWDTALRENNGWVNPLGLYDLDRNVRPVGKAYKKLIADWRDLLATESACLVLPIFLPSEQDDVAVRNQREAARALRRPGDSDDSTPSNPSSGAS